MKFEQQVKITVNGKTVIATVQLTAPGLEREDCLSAKMILAAIASGQNTKYHSRHHKDRVAAIEVCPANVQPAAEVKPAADNKPALRLVA